MWADRRKSGRRCCSSFAGVPPPGRPRPDKPALDAFVSWLEGELDTSAARHVTRGAPAASPPQSVRLQNAIHDLLGLEIDVDPLLPVDDADKNGFDNVANMLSMSPTLLDRYLAAARKLSRLALGIPPVGPVTDTYKVPILLDQSGQGGEDLPLGSRGGFAIRHYFPVDGDYIVKIRLRRQLYDYVIGLESPHQLEVRVDGERVLSSTVGGAETLKAPPQVSLVKSSAIRRGRSTRSTPMPGCRSGSARTPVHGWLASPFSRGRSSPKTDCNRPDAAAGVWKSAMKCSRETRRSTVWRSMDRTPFRVRVIRQAAARFSPAGRRRPARRSRRRQADSLVDRAPRSPAGDRSRNGDAAPFLRGRPAECQLRHRPSIRAGTTARGSEFPVPGRA